jgi:5-(carboxyamino)imidazole ribonucleotide synthase
LRFAATVDVITFDHEHVPIVILEELEKSGVAVHPSSSALLFSQNKLAMREKLANLGLPVPDWQAISTASELEDFLSRHDSQAVLKTPTGGYDGKGVRVINSAADASDWLNGQVLLVEEKVNFVRELAQLSARNVSGEWKSWPVVETIQADGVCSKVLSPAPQADQVQAALIAKRVAEGLNVTGVLAVEMFETSEGNLLINELAMRPHNSGHFSIEGSLTSQFEQHLRAVADLPLGSTEATKPFAVMLNLLGVQNKNTFVEHYPDAMNVQGAHFHNYGKAWRPGRKMGHITVISETSLAQAEEIALAAKAKLQA